MKRPIEHPTADNIARLLNEQLAVLAQLRPAPDDVDVITDVAGKVPLRMSDDTTSIVVRLSVGGAVYVRVAGIYTRPAIVDAVCNGRGVAASAPIVEIALEGPVA